MKIIDTLEDQILSMSPADRIKHLKDISYFIQCTAQLIKAEGGSGTNPLLEELNLAFIGSVTNTAPHPSDVDVLEDSVPED